MARHKSSTKHKEVRPDWNDKNDSKLRALVSHGRVLPMARFMAENIRSSAKRFELWIVLFWTKRHNVSHYIYYLATDNIHIVLENDNTVLIKGLKRLQMLNSPKHLIETSYDKLKIKGEITFQQYRGKSSHKQGFPMGYNIHEHKDITMPFDNSLLFMRAFRTLHKSFHAKS